MKGRIIGAFIWIMALGILLTGCGDRAVTEQSVVGSRTEQQTGSVLPAMTQEDMIAQSTLIVRGVVTERSEPFYIAPSNGGDPGSFTDYTVSVSEVLYGDSGTRQIAVRVQGKTENAGTADYAPELPIDKELLIYLYEPDEDDLYRTDGTYYYVTGMYRGVYLLDTSGDTAQFVNWQNENDPDLQDVWQAEELEASIRAYVQEKRSAA
ncbi:MAG: hypothetical protein Q4P20_04910 [Eubacteriales bacterium]|nr:hypothetical protein [Eubacteriales bacterium]